jgi:hypothetical protein
VETALVISLCFLFVFGIYQYCRILMIRHVCDNAARHAARAAVVHTYDWDTARVQQEVLSQLAGLQSQLSNFTIQVYQADPNTAANLGPWSDAKYGEHIAVQIDGDYTLPMPSLTGGRILDMNTQAIHIQARCIMSSEAN